MDFFENHEIAKWDAQSQTFDRRGLVRAWIGCSEKNLAKNMERAKRGYQKVISFEFLKKSFDSNYLLIFSMEDYGRD